MPQSFSHSNHNLRIFMVHALWLTPNILHSFPLDETSLELPRCLTWYQEKQLLGIKWDVTTQSDHLYQYCITYDNDCLTIEYVSQNESFYL